MRPNVPTARLTMLTPVPANILIFGEASCWSSTSVAEASLMSESPLVQMVCLAIIQRTAVGTARTSASQSMKSSMRSSAIDGVLLGPPAALKAGCAPAVPCVQFFPPTCPVHCETPVSIVTPRSARHHSTQLAPMMVTGVFAAAAALRWKRGTGMPRRSRIPARRTLEKALRRELLEPLGRPDRTPQHASESGLRRSARQVAAHLEPQEGTGCVVDVRGVAHGRTAAADGAAALQREREGRAVWHRVTNAHAARDGPLHQVLDRLLVVRRDGKVHLAATGTVRLDGEVVPGADPAEMFGQVNRARGLTKGEVGLSNQ